jgi:hypothetical protein
MKRTRRRITRTQQQSGSVKCPTPRRNSGKSADRPSHQDRFTFKKNRQRQPSCFWADQPVFSWSAEHLLLSYSSFLQRWVCPVAKQYKCNFDGTMLHFCHLQEVMQLRTKTWILKITVKMTLQMENKSTLVAIVKVGKRTPASFHTI